MRNFLAIIILIIVIILAYAFLFWLLKEISPILIEYDEEDSKGKRQIFFAFILYSGFVITPGYFIFECICKILEFLYS